MIDSEPKDTKNVLVRNMPVSLWKQAGDAARAEGILLRRWIRKVIREALRAKATE